MAESSFKNEYPQAAEKEEVNEFEVFRLTNDGEEHQIGDLNGLAYHNLQELEEAILLLLIENPLPGYGAPETYTYWYIFQECFLYLTSHDLSGMPWNQVVEMKITRVDAMDQPAEDEDEGGVGVEEDKGGDEDEDQPAEDEDEGGDEDEDQPAEDEDQGGVGVEEDEGGDEDEDQPAEDEDQGGDEDQSSDESTITVE